MIEEQAAAHDVKGRRIVNTEIVMHPIWCNVDFAAKAVQISRRLSRPNLRR